MSGGKVRSRAIDAGGQAFFEALRPLATAVAKGEWAEVDRLRNELNSDPDVDAAIDKQARGQELTTKEQRLVDRAEAMDMLGDAENMSLEEVMAIMEDLKLTAGFSNISLKNTRLRRAAFRAAKNREAASALRARYPSLTHDDGTPLNDDELQTLQDAVRHVWRGGKGKGLSANVKGKIEASKMFMSNFNLSEGKRFILSMFNGVKHLGTYLNKLDPYLYDNIYNQLNRMGSKSLKGYFEQTDLLDDIANSIGSNTKGYKGLQEKLFVEDMLALPNATDIKGNRMRNVQINKDQALRIYALYKNQEQRNKLVKQGFDADVIAEIETFIGPDLKEFADKIVEYLSNEYFESINYVYAGVNDVNLPQIEDYFPTITLSPNIGKDLLIDGDFGGIFNAETSPALKLRTDTTSSVSILADFSSVLDNHFKQMERYKAYAAGVRDMSDLFRDNTVNALFNSLGTKRVIKGLINNAINPDSGKNALTGSDNKLMEKIQTMFTKMVLAFKPMQFIKQSTSLVTSIADYSYRGPGRMNLAIDLPMYMVDLAWTLANFRTVYKQAKAISPEFRYRVAMGVKGDVVGLYGGSKTYKAAEMMRTKKGGAVRAFQQAGSSFTTAGDIVGVMGYMVNYRRDIINGMDQQAALEKFEDYNQTQQSRRPTDKNSFQQNPTAITRAFTMFGSTNFLYMNNVMMSGTNILRDISDGKRPAKKDIRKFVMNLGLANAAFVFMSNIFKYMQGDDEDRETVYGDMVRSALGLSVLYQIPFFAAPVKNFDTWLTGKRHFTSTALNPLERISREFIKAVKGKEYDDALQTLAEIGLQTNIDPAIAMKDIVKDGEFDQQSMYKILGVSKSYQPGN